jgi:hypothetical protein
MPAEGPHPSDARAEAGSLGEHGLGRSRVHVLSSADRPDYEATDEEVGIVTADADPARTM